MLTHERSYLLILFRASFFCPVVWLWRMWFYSCRKQLLAWTHDSVCCMLLLKKQNYIFLICYLLAIFTSDFLNTVVKRAITRKRESGAEGRKRRMLEGIESEQSSKFFASLVKRPAPSVNTVESEGDSKTQLKLYKAKWRLVNLQMMIATVRQWKIRTWWIKILVIEEILS